ncbi:MAG: hypothetical protein SGCHY_005603 [Lobulomycetales sp.]
MSVFHLLPVLLSLSAAHTPGARGGDHHHHNCGHVELEGEYNVSHHWMAAIIIVFVSLAGSLTPILIQNRSKFLVQCGTLFGAGTILATGFIHMMTGAYQNLTHECLPKSVPEYDWPGLIAMSTILLVHLIEFLMHRALKGDSACEEKADVEKHHDHHQHHHHHHHPGAFVSEATKMKRISVAILEVGIAAHSVIIGIALGVAAGSEFVTLLVAICFHQFFEGLALGSTIVSAEYTSGKKAYILGGIYAITTPLGVAIGIAMHSSFSSTNGTGLLVQGIFDAASAGILIYTALVEFLAGTFSSPDFKNQSGARQLVLFACLYLGCFSMAVVGVFA